MVTLAYGNGDSWIATEESIPRYMESAEYLRQGALRFGYSLEEANQMFTLRILKDGEFVPIKQPE